MSKMYLSEIKIGKKVFVRVERVAEMLGFNEQTVRRLARCGDIPAKKIRNTWWFNPDDVQRCLFGSETLNPKTKTYRKAAS